MYDGRAHLEVASHSKALLSTPSAGSDESTANIQQRTRIFLRHLMQPHTCAQTTAVKCLVLCVMVFRDAMQTLVGR